MNGLKLVLYLYTRDPQGEVLTKKLHDQGDKGLEKGTGATTSQLIRFQGRLYHPAKYMSASS